MSVPSSPSSQPSSLTSEPVQVNHPIVTAQSPPSTASSPFSNSSIEHQTGLSDISSLDAEELEDYDIVESSILSNPDSESTSHSNQMNDTIRTRSVRSNLSREGADGGRSQDSQSETNEYHSRSSQTEDSASSNSSEPRFIGLEGSTRSQSQLGLNHSTPNQSGYLPTAHSSTQRDSPPSVHSKYHSNSRSTVALDSNLTSEAESATSLPPLHQSQLSSYSDQEELDPNLNSSSNLSFPDPMGQSFQDSTAQLEQEEVELENGNVEMGVQADLEGQDKEWEASNQHERQRANLEGAVKSNPSKLPLSESFAFLSDQSTSPSLETQHLSPTVSPKVGSDGYRCISRGGKEKSTHNRNPWLGQKSVASQDSGSTRAHQDDGSVRGLGFDPLGNGEELHLRRELNQEEASHEDGWSDGSIEKEVYSILRTESSGEEKGFCPSPVRSPMTDDQELHSESGESYLTGSGKGGTRTPALIRSTKLSKAAAAEPDSEIKAQVQVEEEVQPETEASHQHLLFKRVLNNSSLASAMGMAGPSSIPASTSTNPSDKDQSRQPIWKKRIPVWLNKSQDPVPAFSSSSTSSSADPKQQRERERETSPTEEGNKHNAEHSAVEYTQSIDRAEEQGLNIFDPMAGAGKAYSSKGKERDIELQPSSKVSEDASATNKSQVKTPGSAFNSRILPTLPPTSSTRFAGSPKAKGLLAQGRRLEQRKERHRQLEFEQARGSSLKSKLNTFSSKMPFKNVGLDALTLLMTFGLVLFTCFVIWNHRSGTGSNTPPSLSKPKTLVESTYAPASLSSHFKKRLNLNERSKVTSVDKFAETSLSYGSSSKAKALALFESTATSEYLSFNNNSKSTSSGKISGAIDQSKELSIHLYDDFSAFLKDGSESASKWISSNRSAKEKAASSSKDPGFSEKLSNAISNLSSLVSSHFAEVFGQLLASARKEWELYAEELLRIWRMIVALTKEFETFSRPYRVWIFSQSKRLSENIVENGRTLSNEIQKLELKSKILQQLEAQRVKIHYKKKHFQQQTLKTKRSILKACEHEVKEERIKDLKAEEENFKREVGKRIPLFKSSEDNNPKTSRLNSHPASTSSTGQPLNAKFLIDSDRDLLIECIKSRARTHHSSTSERIESTFYKGVDGAFFIRSGIDDLFNRAVKGAKTIKSNAEDLNQKALDFVGVKGSMENWKKRQEQKSNRLRAKMDDIRKRKTAQGRKEKGGKGKAKKETGRTKGGKKKGIKQRSK